MEDQRLKGDFRTTTSDRAGGLLCKDRTKWLPNGYPSKQHYAIGFSTSHKKITADNLRGLSLSIRVNDSAEAVSRGCR
ncbi:hypothetical protein J6590_012743 [Homalodisca vitripennis]|nr:hypothetical protein J6590_012743 [Homalodisca vitripennis]